MSRGLGDVYKRQIPDNAIEIVIEKDLEKGFDYRKITIGQEAV